jgi:hypothetical protein
MLQALSTLLDGILFQIAKLPVHRITKSADLFEWILPDHFSDTDQLNAVLMLRKYDLIASGVYVFPLLVRRSLSATKKLITSSWVKLDIFVAVPRRTHSVLSESWSCS